MNNKELAAEVAALRAEVAALRAELFGRPIVISIPEPSWVPQPSWPTYPQITCSTTELRSVS